MIIDLAKQTMKLWAKEQRRTLPFRINILINMAKYDLYFGPTQVGERDDDNTLEYPGFVTACNEIREATEEIIRPLWVDVHSGEIMDKEPEEWRDEEGDWCWPIWDDIYKFDTEDVKRIFFGKELAKYI